MEKFHRNGKQKCLKAYFFVICGLLDAAACPFDHAGKRKIKYLVLNSPQTHPFAIPVVFFFLVSPQALFRSNEFMMTGSIRVYQFQFLGNLINCTYGNGLVLV